MEILQLLHLKILIQMEQAKDKKELMESKNTITEILKIQEK